MKPSTNATLARLSLLFALLLTAPALQACRDTIVFAAQREIDVAISVNEDEAEPVYVNVGLDSRMGAIVPAIGEKQSAQGNKSASTQPTPAEAAGQARGAFGLSNPEGEAASIFSGFYYDSDAEVSPTAGANPIKYDAQIRSQFASGAAAVILANSPRAVDQVVSVNEIHTTPGPEFLNEERLKLVQSLWDTIGAPGFEAAKLTELYNSPPTNDPDSQAIVNGIEAERGGHDACAADAECRLDIVATRLRKTPTLEDAKRWQAAIERS